MKLPKFVKLNNTALRLRGKSYVRDYIVAYNKDVAKSNHYKQIKGYGHNKDHLEVFIDKNI